MEKYYFIINLKEYILVIAETQVIAKDAFKFRHSKGYINIFTEQTFKTGKQELLETIIQRETQQ